MNVHKKKSHKARQVIAFLTYERNGKRIPVGRHHKTGWHEFRLPSSMVLHMASTRGTSVSNWGFLSWIADEYKNVRVERTTINHDNPVRRFF